MADIDTIVEKSINEASYEKIMDLYNKYGIPLTSIEAFLPFVLSAIENGNSNLIYDITKNDSDKDLIYDWLKKYKFISEDEKINLNRDITLQDAASFANYIIKEFNHSDSFQKRKKYRLSDMLKIGTQRIGDSSRSQITDELNNNESGFNNLINKLRRNNVVYSDDIEKQLSKYLGRFGKNKDNESIDSDDSDYKYKYREKESPASFNTYSKYVTDTLDNILKMTVNTKIKLDDNLKSQFIEALDVAIEKSKDSLSDNNKKVLDIYKNKIKSSNDIIDVQNILGQSISLINYSRNPMGTSSDDVVNEFIDKINSYVPGIDLSTNYIDRDLGYSKHDYTDDQYLLRLNMIHLLSLKFNVESKKDSVEGIFKSIDDKLNNLPSDINDKIKNINTVLKYLSDLDWCVNSKYDEQYKSLKNRVKDIIQKDDIILTSFINKINDDYTTLIKDAPVKDFDDNISKSLNDSLIRYLDFNLDFLQEISNNPSIEELKKKIESNNIFKDRENIKPIKFDDDIINKLGVYAKGTSNIIRVVQFISKKISNSISDFKKVHTLSIDNVYDKVYKDLQNLKDNNVDKNSDQYKQLQDIVDSFFIEVDPGKFKKRNFQPNSESFIELKNKIKDYYKKYNKNNEVKNDLKVDNFIDIISKLPESDLIDFINYLNDSKLIEDFNKSKNKVNFLIRNLTSDQQNKFIEFIKSKKPEVVGDLLYKLFNQPYKELDVKQLETEIPSLYKMFNPTSPGGVSGFKKDVFMNVDEIDNKNYINKLYDKSISSIDINKLNDINIRIDNVKKLIKNLIAITKEYKNEILSKRETISDIENSNSIISILPIIIDKLNTPISVKELLVKLDNGELQSVISDIVFYKDIDNFNNSLSLDYNYLVNDLKDIVVLIDKLGIKSINDIEKEIQKDREEKFYTKIPDYKNYQMVTDYNRRSKLSNKLFERLADLSQFSLNDLNFVLLQTNNIENDLLDVNKLNDDVIKSLAYKVTPYLTKGDKNDILENLKFLEYNEILNLPKKDLDNVVDKIYNILNEKNINNKTVSKEEQKAIDSCKKRIDDNKEIYNLAEETLNSVRFNRSIFKYSRLTPEMLKATNFYIVDKIKDIVNLIISKISTVYKVDLDNIKSDLYLYALNICGLYESNGDLIQNDLDKINFLSINNIMNPSDLYKKNYDVPAKVYYGKNQYSYAKEEPLEFLMKKIDKLKFFKGTDYEKYLYVYNNLLNDDFKFLKNRIQDDINNSNPNVKQYLKDTFTEIENCFENEIKTDVDNLIQVIRNLKSIIRNDLNSTEFKKYIYFDINKFNDYLNSNFNTKIIPFSIRVNELNKSKLNNKYSDYDESLSTVVNYISSYKNLLDLGLDENGNKLSSLDRSKMQNTINYLSDIFNNTLQKLYDKGIIFEKTIIFNINRLLNIIKDTINNDVKPLEKKLFDSIVKFKQLVQDYERIKQIK